MSVLLGLVAACGWGVTDFLARFAARDIGLFRALFYGQSVGLALVTLAVAATHDRLPTLGEAGVGWGMALLSAAATLLATYALFRGLIAGAIALVAPVSAGYGAVTAVLSALAGERLGGATALGILLTVAGVVLAATQEPPTTAEGTPRGGLPWALTAAGGYGVGFWLQGGWAVPQLGHLLPVWAYYATGMTILILASGPARIALEPRPSPTWPCVLGTGLAGALAYLAFAAGAAGGSVAVVTVVSSLSSAVTVLLACTLLRERLHRRQWVGLAAIGAGLVLINLPR